MRTLIWASLFAFLTAAAGQTPEETHKFEIADVHASGKGWNSPTRVSARNGRYEIRNATMLNLIRNAWAFDPNRILGGPNWLELDRFDVVAKMPDGTGVEEQRLMLQDLLRERFGLAIHNDTKPIPQWALVAGNKRSQLKEADGQGESGCKLRTDTGPEAVGGTRITLANPDGTNTALNLGPGFIIQYQCRNMTMAAFAAGLRTMRGVTINTPVSDQTGLEGRWNFDLKWSFPIYGPPTTADLISLADALDKQLGLKLEERPMPQPVLVVDKVNRKPTENAPGVSDVLPPLKDPTEFEVAEVKLTDPNARVGARMQMQPGGRFIVQALPLRLLLMNAFNVSNIQVVGIPGWADSLRIDITAKTPEGAANSPGFDPEVLAPLLRNLFSDRFGLKYHEEQRSLPAYSLVAAKPKLKKADPESRSYCRILPPGPGTLPGMQTIECRNATMELFVGRLRVPGSNTPIADATGLEGGWDLTFTYNVAAPRLPNAARDGDANQPVPIASDPAGQNPFFDTIEKQLGLKLELRKRQMPVFVIDHLEQTPVEN